MDGGFIIRLPFFEKRSPFQTFPWVPVLLVYLLQNHLVEIYQNHSLVSSQKQQAVEYTMEDPSLFAKREQ
jgi:hypothetical protein